MINIVRKKSGGYCTGDHGFSMVEVIVAGAVSLIVLVTIIYGWTFSQKIWTNEHDRTIVRINLMKALERMKEDTRLSSISSGSMIFYPEVEGAYTAVSLLVAEPDEDGLLTLNAVTKKIDWDKTVMYHVYDDGSGGKVLRRTVYDGVLETESERLAQLQSVISAGGSIGSGYATETKFLPDLESFEISPLSSVVDFYTDSADEVPVNNVLFGWVKLTDGDHTIRFENVEKNPDSSGDTIAIDFITIDPSGSDREMEFYTPSVSGGSLNEPYGLEYGNNQYLEFAATGIGSFMEVTDGYDLWRESSFEDVALSQMELEEFPLRARLKVPMEDDEGDYAWSAPDEVSSYGVDGEILGDSSSGSGWAPPVVFRTVISASNIEWSRPFVKVSLESSTTSSLMVDRVYITRRDGTSGSKGLVNLDPSADTDPDWKNYHMHQQLFFKDDAGNVNESVFIPAGEKKWSLWTAFPLDETKDYFISVYVSTPAYFECKVWENAGADTKTYYLTPYPGALWTDCTVDPATDLFTSPGHSLMDGDLIAVDGAPAPEGLYTRPALDALAGRPDWLLYYVVDVVGDTFKVSLTDGGPGVDILATGTGSGIDVKFMRLGESPHIYITSEIDTWDTTGEVTSSVFDTTVADPQYGNIKWSEAVQSGASVKVKARSSDNEDMQGVSDWGIVGAYTTSGSSLNIGQGRYVQFQAELTTIPFWETASDSMTYSEYLTAQSGLSPEVFPKDGSSEPYVTGAYSTWIDDVEIDWEGEERICAIKGNILKKDSFGRVMVTVDGNPLLKTLSMNVAVSKDTVEGLIEEEGTVDIEPLNTGK